MTLPLSIIIAHGIFDWFCQTDWMALNKSKSNYALFCHVAVYSFGMFLWATWWFGPTDIAAMFLLVTALTHFATDWVTSRINAKLWQADERHWFFCMIQLDQLIHYGTLALTLEFLS